MEFVVSFPASINTRTALTTIRKLAQGKSDVYHVKNPSNSEEYAVKAFFQDEASFKRYRREKQMICALDHPNIIKYYPIVEHNSECDLILTDYATNSDFFTLIKKGGLNHEVHMRTYFYQLITGLEYMHSMGIAHLDLKLENLLLDKNFRLKIIDFDQSHNKMEDVGSAGTSGYRPPEIKTKTCNDAFAADIYSAGIILYAFKARKFPFIEVEEDGQSKVLSYDLFMENNEQFWKTKAEQDRQKEDFFGQDFKELLKGMLERDPTKRFTIQQIKASVWFNKPILPQESLEAYMNQFSRGNNNRSPSINNTPKHFKPSSFPGITSPKAKTINLSLNLWKCSSPKATKENFDKRQFEEGSEVTKTEESRVDKKSGFDFKIWNLVSPKSSKQGPVIKKDNEGKSTFFGSSTATLTTTEDLPPRKKSSFNLKFWNLGSPKASIPKIPQISNQDINSGVKPAKRTDGEEKTEKVEKVEKVEKLEKPQRTGKNGVTAHRRRPVQLTYLS